MIIIGSAANPYNCPEGTGWIASSSGMCYWMTGSSQPKSNSHAKQYCKDESGSTQATLVEITDSTVYDLLVQMYAKNDNPEDLTNKYKYTYKQIYGKYATRVTSRLS